jgi:hypothetical protein
VGFGDNSGNNTTERIVSSIIMVAGVIGFSFASGSLAAIMNNLDLHSARINQKSETLEKILSAHNLPEALIFELRQSIKFDAVKFDEKTQEFTDSLPPKLQALISLEMNCDFYYKIHILSSNNYSQSFYAWFGKNLKHICHCVGQNIY